MREPVHYAFAVHDIKDPKKSLFTRIWTILPNVGDVLESDGAYYEVASRVMDADNGVVPMNIRLYVNRR